MPKAEKEIERDKIKFERFKEVLEELGFNITGDCFDNLVVKDHLGNWVLKDRKNVDGSGYIIYDYSSFSSQYSIFVAYSNGIEIGVETVYDTENMQIPRGESIEIRYTFPKDDKSHNKEEEKINFIITTEASRPNARLFIGSTKVGVRMVPDTELACVDIYHNECGINYFEYCPVEDTNGKRFDTPDKVTDELRKLFYSIIDEKKNPNRGELKFFIDIMLSMNNRSMKGLEDYFDYNIDRHINTLENRVKLIDWEIQAKEEERTACEEKISGLRKRKEKKVLSKKKKGSQQQD